MILIFHTLYSSDLDYVVDALNANPDILVNLDLSGCSNLTEITDMQFEDISNLKSIILPSSVKEIRGYAFRECSNLTSITLPEGIDTIYSFTFYNCKALTSITIPTTVTSI